VKEIAVPRGTLFLTSPIAAFGHPCAQCSSFNRAWFFSKLLKGSGYPASVSNYLRGILYSVRGRDLGGAVEEAIAKVSKQVRLPPGYHINWALVSKTGF
jgi:hypothetical protein